MKFILEYHLIGGEYYEIQADSRQDAERQALTLEPEFGQQCSECGDSIWYLREVSKEA